MSKDKLYKLQGKKIIPINRFNLKPSNPSQNFRNTNPKNFSVIMHPVVNSLYLEALPLLHYPLIENKSKINPQSIFKEAGNPKLNLKFPKVELQPIDNTIFYYENVYGKDNQVCGYLGKVMFKYKINTDKKEQNFKYINIKLKQAVLNLKLANSEKLAINGKVDVNKNEIIFNLKDEAVKIAFTNLITEFSDLIPDIDLYFDFKGYSKPVKNAYLSLLPSMFKTLNLKNTPKISSSLSNKSSLINAVLAKPKFNLLVKPLIANIKPKS